MKCFVVLSLSLSLSWLASAQFARCSVQAGSLESPVASGHQSPAESRKPSDSRHDTSLAGRAVERTPERQWPLLTNGHYSRSTANIVAEQMQNFHLVAPKNATSWPLSFSLSLSLSLSCTSAACDDDDNDAAAEEASGARKLAKGGSAATVAFVVARKSCHRRRRRVNGTHFNLQFHRCAR